MMLTIGMANRGEPDHVWFVLQALHTYHPRVNYLVIDNSPERSPPVESVCRAVGGRYVHRPDLTGTSAPRDAVFRYAATPWVMCLDSHVFLEPGGVQAALDHITRYPESNDLIQGPIIGDDGRWYATHWERKADPGLWGVWAQDPRGTDPRGEPFEIDMTGLGLWMMRKEAWPGFNVLFRGFGGEEGYIHELVRRRGGKALCHPALRWRHKFRDAGGWHKNAPPPYPLSAEDHAWNLLIGHRELGVRADTEIRAHMAKGWPDDKWNQLVAAADAAQPFGEPRREVLRQKILALWYSDSTPPEQLLRKSAMSVASAAAQATRHDVTVSTCQWQMFDAAKLGHFSSAFRGEKVRGYANIVAQIRQAVEQATAHGGVYDAVAFCEHDVLYPPGYFDRLGDALGFNPEADVVSHLDYIGLNQTGWQKLKARHEPLHQMCMRWPTFAANMERVTAEAATGAPVVFEPVHDKSLNWVRLQPSDYSGMTGTPSVHVNHAAGRLTSHGEVCYEPRGVGEWHPHWGEAQKWWPGTVTAPAPDPNQFRSVSPAPNNSGCGACAASKHQTLEKWYEAALNTPSDFHEHVKTLRELAAGCASAVEFSWWGKPADVALAAGLGEKGTFTSVSPHGKGQWAHLSRWMGDRFKAFKEDPHTVVLPDPVDLAFIDTQHTAESLMRVLQNNIGRFQKYIVVHCTETYGERGDVPNAPGVLHALRTFCHQNKEWVVKRHDLNNHGLMVLSRCPEDVKDKPAFVTRGINWIGAMARLAASGVKSVPLEVLEERQKACALCEERAIDHCAACGCPLAKKLPLPTEECGLSKKGLPPKWSRYEGAA